MFKTIKNTFAIGWKITKEINNVMNEIYQYEPLNQSTSYGDIVDYNRKGYYVTYTKNTYDSYSSQYKIQGIFKTKCEAEKYQGFDRISYP